MNPNIDVLVMSSASLRIKCTIPKTTESAMKAVYAAFKEVTEENKRNCTVTSMTEPILVKEAYEFVVEVLPFNLKIALFDLMHSFLTLAKDKNFASHMMPVALVSSPSFFSNSCTPAHTSIAIQSLYFGNILNSGALGVHWTVEFYKPKARYNIREREQEIMLASFEHDRGSVTVRFKFREKKKNEIQSVEFAVKFYYNAIRRIIVDPISRDDDRKNKKFRFHFDLNCPPEIRSFVNKDKDIMRFGDGKRLVYLSRGWGKDGKESSGPHELAGPESSVVCLEFAELYQQDRGMQELFDILSRIRVRAGIPIEFASMDLLNLHWAHYTRYHPYVKEAIHPQNKAYIERIEWAAPNPVLKKDKHLNNVCAAQFKLRYIIEALLSRGARVKDQLLLNEQTWTTFLDLVCGQYKKDPKKTLTVMESVINRVDEMSFPIVSIFCVIQEELKAYEEMKKLNDSQMGSEARDENMEREGYVKVRKIVITPTRYVYVAPEQIMGNRIIRKYYRTGTELLRITFRDDDNQPLRSNTTGEKMTEDTVSKALQNGIIVGGRNFRYLGSSNSQMRDNGCYFAYDRAQTEYKVTQRRDRTIRTPLPSDRIAKIRKNMGKLDNLTNVAKFMARMGQCFTQSRPVSTGLPKLTSNFIFDITGGNSADNGGEMYTFSDGCGQISVEYIKRIATDMKLPNYPSVIQFRHRGFKGVLSLHPPLDDINKLTRKLEYITEEEINKDGVTEVTVTSRTQDEDGNYFKLLNCRFRNSQMKFETNPQTEFEVVKISAPTPVALNKPFINILDQASEKQSVECHNRLCDRVEELLQRQLRLMADTLVREKPCRDKLKELPRRVSIDCLSRQQGFALTTEPYFRSLVKAANRCMIKKQLNKEQIPIPLDLGRTMFGCIDETGLLQYGQVFFQYHVNVSVKTPRASAAKIIHEGPTLITKNPCISSGDVRMFDAVDIPALHHLVDVIVFPMHGPRPHPDEMAGSDLDGDEYSVIWDPKLFFERNEEASVFKKEASQAMKLDMKLTGVYEDDDAKEKARKEMFKQVDESLQKFFIDYLTQDSVGMIANAHLNNSDMWGLESKVAKILATKHSQAVDFPKTAVAPEALTKDWTEELNEQGEKTGDELPPQRAHRKPDFMQSNRDPVYASTRLIGRIYREINDVDNVLALSEEKDQQEEISIDALIDVNGWEQYKDAALAQMMVYNNEIKALMERYGIASEGELMSGCRISIRNAISDRESDDMSFFNTNQVIETQVTQIVRTHREKFFKDFGEIRLLTSVASDRRNVSDDTEDIFEREVSSPSVSMQQKAVAMYKVTYDYVSRQRDSSARLLSYPWIAYDVLARVREEKMREQTDFIAGLEPVEMMLSAQVRDSARANGRKFREKVSSWTGEDGKGNGEEAICRYLNYYDGLAELAFFFVSWAEHESISMRHFQETHIVLLLIQFCLGSVDELEAVIVPIAEKTTPLEPRVCITELGHVVINSLRWLSSRSFKKMRNLNFQKAGLNVEGCFMRGEWIPMHLAATKSFFELIFSLRIDLPSDGPDAIAAPRIIREMTPFVIELPKDFINLDPVALMIRNQTGAREVRLRRLTTGEQTRVVVCATGSPLSHSNIRKLLIVPLEIRTSENAKEMANSFPAYILAKITEGSARFEAANGLTTA